MLKVDALIIRKESCEGKDPHQIALRMMPTTVRVRQFKWNTFMATLAYFRKRAFRWYGKINRSPSRSLQNWINAAPFLMEWTLSDRCLVSPHTWPNEILCAFRYRLIPSPWEIANINMNFKYVTTTKGISCHLYLLAYAMGFSVNELAKIMNVSRQIVIYNMYEGVENLFSIPQFVIWATATDFGHALPPLMFKTRRRNALVAKLRANPFKVKDELANTLVTSSAYLNYLIYGSPKQLRVSGSYRIYRTIEAYNGEET